MPGPFGKLGPEGHPERTQHVWEAGGARVADSNA